MANPNFLKVGTGVIVAPAAATVTNHSGHWEFSDKVPKCIQPETEQRCAARNMCVRASIISVEGNDAATRILLASVLHVLRTTAKILSRLDGSNLS